MTTIINRSNKYVMPFGKFRGQSLQDIMVKHESYFEWLDQMAYGEFKEVLNKIKEELKWQNQQEKK